MEIIYKDDMLEIKSYDFNSENSSEMIDFFIIFNGAEYSCSAFTLEFLNKFLNSKDSSFFWSVSSIIIQNATKECLIKSVLEIINDKSLKLEDIFTKSR